MLIEFNDESAFILFAIYHSWAKNCYFEPDNFSTNVHYLFLKMMSSL